MSDELLKRLETGHDKECAMSYGMHEHCCDCSYPARQEAAARVRELEAELAASMMKLEGVGRTLATVNAIAQEWKQAADAHPRTVMAGGAIAFARAVEAEATEALRADNERLRALLMRVRERGLNAPLDSAIEEALGGAPPRDDTARLDWLDAHWHSAFVAKTERGYLPWRDGTDYVVGLREAIDAARGNDAD